MAAVASAASRSPDRAARHPGAGAAAWPLLIDRPCTACSARGGHHGTLRDRTAYAAARVGGGGEGLLRRRRPRLRVPRRAALAERAAARPRRSGRRLPDDREGPHVRRELRLPLDGERRRLGGARQAVCRLLFGGAGGHLRAGGFAQSPRRSSLPACRSRWATSRAATTRRSRRWSSTCRSATISAVVRRRAAVPADGEADRRRGAGGVAVQRARTTSPSSLASAR